MTERDPFDDPAWQRYQRAVLREMLPKLVESSVCLSLAPDDEGDVKYWVELGASIMLDKPIFVLISPGREIPAKLRKVADRVIMVDMETDRGRHEAAQAIEAAIAVHEDARSGG